MIQRAVTAIIGVVIGLFATFAVFSAILGGLDSLYLTTRDSCNYGTANAPKRALHVVEVAGPGLDPDDVDWSAAFGLQEADASIGCSFDTMLPADPISKGTTRYFITPTGDYIRIVFPSLGALTPVMPGTPIAPGSGGSTTISPPLSWLPAEGVFTAQRQLVTLLAVIAAIGMPIGAMTAIVFFGQAVISSGVSGQGSSQVLVAIASVVVILVAVQMFQQFAGYLGNAFDAVDGDRFEVFEEPLGSLAETIAEFWGVLAFAGLINIATIVWRNYSGNFNIGGGGGL